MKKLIIFDLDGTLIDTLEDLKNSVNYALSCKNYPIRTKEQVRKAIGNGVSKLIERLLPNGVSNEEYFDTLEIFKKHYDIHYQDNTIPYKGVITLLMQLKNDGYLLSVCTNKIQEVSEKLINRFYPGLFDLVVGDQEGLKKKPEKDMIVKTLEILKVSKEDALYIGDTEVDKQTAVNSGLDYIMEGYGYRTIEEWKVLDPNLDIKKTPQEVYKTIKQM